MFFERASSSPRTKGRKTRRVNQETIENIEDTYPACRRCMTPEAWGRSGSLCAKGRGPEDLPQILFCEVDSHSLPSYLPELALLELTLSRVRTAQCAVSLPISQLTVNPSLQLLRLSWKGLTRLLTTSEAGSTPAPESAEEYVIVWRHPGTGEALVRPATDEDLLVLKMATEEVAPSQLAGAGQVKRHELDAAVDRAMKGGLLLAPPSGIRRDLSDFPMGAQFGEDFLSSSVFTLQWHITQACDLHCRHCYDRSDKRSLELPQALRVLDDLLEFCRSRKVRGQVSFTGGNPLLYPHFMEVYRAASERGFSLAVLGNPAPHESIENLISIEPPVYYQVSLEGLPEHNDTIRGHGHFERVLEFLACCAGSKSIPW